MVVLRFFLLLCILGCVLALCRCTQQQVMPIRAMAQDIAVNCPLDITVRECLRNLIDESANAYREEQRDGGTE